MTSTLTALGLAPPGSIPFVEDAIRAGAQSGYLLAEQAEHIEAPREHQGYRQVVSIAKKWSNTSRVG